MVNFVSTETVTVCNTVQEAATALGTALEATVNTTTVRTCDIIKIEANKYAAVVVVTDAVA